MRNERLVVSRERLLDEVWGYDPMAATNTIDVFISNLRRKLEAGERAAAAAHQTRRRLRAQGLAMAAPPSARADRGAGASRPGSWPVRWRLAAVSAGLTLVILLLFGGVIGAVATQRIRDDFNSEVRSAAQILAGEIQIVYTPVRRTGRPRRPAARRLRPPRRRLGPRLRRQRQR